MKYLYTSSIITFILSVFISVFIGRTNTVKYINAAPPIAKDISIETKTISTGKLAKANKRTFVYTEKVSIHDVYSNNLLGIKVGVSDHKISQILSSISSNMEAKRLTYNAKLKQDCSGIFHQIKDSLQSRLPALSANNGVFKYPSSKEARSSRQIADWYYRNNNLLIVEDANASANIIRPGTVLFYGKSNKRFQNIDIDMLTNRKNNYSSKGAIVHIAVVTAVTLDNKGNLVDYTIMHGRSHGKHASRTKSKAIQSNHHLELPPFGNWSQQLVAIANILTPVN